MSSKKEARRQEILNGALAIFAEKGYDKTTMDDVVKATGLSKGTLYWHFKNKQHIYIALITTMTDQAMELFDQLLQTKVDDLSPPDALRKMFINTVELLENNPIFPNMTADFFLQAFRYEEIMSKVGGYYVKFIDRIAIILQQGIDQGYFKEINVNEVATVLAASLDGLSLLKIIEKTLAEQMGMPLNSRAVFEAGANLMLNGLMKENNNV
jgi:AcrR family transcriptional regulator